MRVFLIEVFENKRDRMSDVGIMEIWRVEDRG